MYVILICYTTWKEIPNLLSSETSLLNVTAHLHTQFSHENSYISKFVTFNNAQFQMQLK